jgi:very-long-chain (3R)-3-hydroxyacyl-CoA dehydratase
VLSAAGWTLVLYRTVEHLFAIATSGSSASSSLFATLKPPVWVPSVLPARLVPFYQRACTTYDVVGSTTAIVQSAAVLEVLHVLLGLVRSPLPTTAVQVASRLFSVWCLADKFPSVRPPLSLSLSQKTKTISPVFFFPFLLCCAKKKTKKNKKKAKRSPFYASMVLSWALTEVIRYTFYAASLVGWGFAPLLWLRYSTFFVLYPTGAGSEAFVNLATLPVSIATGGSWFSMLPLKQWDEYSYLRGIFFVVWWPGKSPDLFSLFGFELVALCFPMLTDGMDR